VQRKKKEGEKGHGTLCLRLEEHHVWLVPIALRWKPVCKLTTPLAVLVISELPAKKKKKGGRKKTGRPVSDLSYLHSERRDLQHFSDCLKVHGGVRAAFARRTFCLGAKKKRKKRDEKRGEKKQRWPVNLVARL